MNVIWKQEIAKMIYIKMELRKIDVGGMYPYHFPKIAAPSDVINKCEGVLGFSLNTEYRGFLNCADGWDGFVQAADLFGTQDFLRSDRYVAAEDLLNSYEEDIFSQLSISRDFIFPIAFSKPDGDIFAMIKPGNLHEGRIFWFAGYLVDQYSSFSEFFLAMMDYNRMGIDSIKN